MLAFLSKSRRRRPKSGRQGLIKWPGPGYLFYIEAPLCSYGAALIHMEQLDIEDRSVFYYIESREQRACSSRFSTCYMESCVVSFIRCKVKLDLMSMTAEIGGEHV